jgi:hypothetical protein
VSEKRIAVLPVADYINYVQELIQIESKFTAFYLSEKLTFLKVVETLESVMIKDHKDLILSKFEEIIEDNEVLITLYEFVQQTGLLPDFILAFKKYITTHATLILTNKLEPSESINAIVTIVQRCKAIQTVLDTEALKIP